MCVAVHAHYVLICDPQWTYLGRYTTSPLPSADMRLSEWMVLDEQVRRAHLRFPLG
jgi:hypothetical protein